MPKIPLGETFRRERLGLPKQRIDTTIPTPEADAQRMLGQAIKGASGLLTEVAANYETAKDLAIKQRAEITIRTNLRDAYKKVIEAKGVDALASRENFEEAVKGIKSDIKNLVPSHLQDEVTLKYLDEKKLYDIKVIQYEQSETELLREENLKDTMILLQDRVKEDVFQLLPTIEEAKDYINESHSELSKEERNNMLREEVDKIAIAVADTLLESNQTKDKDLLIKWLSKDGILNKYILDTGKQEKYMDSAEKTKDAIVKEADEEAEKAEEELFDSKRRAISENPPTNIMDFNKNKTEIDKMPLSDKRKDELDKHNKDRYNEKENLYEYTDDATYAELSTRVNTDWENITLDDIHDFKYNYERDKNKSKEELTIISTGDAEKLSKRLTTLKNKETDSSRKGDLKRAHKILEKARQDGVFDDDPQKNNVIWGKFASEIDDWTEKNPEESPIEKLEELLTEPKVKFVDHLLDVFWFGQPGTERARREEIKTFIEETKIPEVEVKPKVKKEIKKPTKEKPEIEPELKPITLSQEKFNSLQIQAKTNLVKGATKEAIQTEMNRLLQEEAISILKKRNKVINQESISKVMRALGK